MNLRIYRIKGRTSGTNRLVKAGSQAKGLSHVVKSDYDIAVASDTEVADLMAQGVTVEDASKADPQSTLLPRSNQMPIDWKYKIKAVNPCSGNEHTEHDSILFLAKDKAVPVMLRAYTAECERLGTNPAHLDAMRLLMARVDDYQREIASKVPDTDLPCEIDRCVNGVGIAASVSTTTTQE